MKPINHDQNSRIFTNSKYYFLSIFLCLSTIVSAQPADELYSHGNKYYEEKNYKAAQHFFSQAASQGNADALYNLGTMYAVGQGVPQNYFKAKQYFLQAADKGHAKSLDGLGHMYSIGYGVSSIDEQKALYYYQQAADKGDINAMLTLGNFYQYGITVPIDIPKAQQYYLRIVQHYQESVHNGNVEAILEIAEIYYLYLENEQEAIKYYQQAANKGNVVAKTKLGYLYSNGFKEGIENDYLREYLQLACLDNLSTACEILAKMNQYTPKNN